MTAGGQDHDVITGIHAVVFSPQAEEVRGFFTGTLGMPSVDAGAGWAIFALPRPSLPYIPPAGTPITSST